MGLIRVGLGGSGVVEGVRAPKFSSGYEPSYAIAVLRRKVR